MSLSIDAAQSDARTNPPTLAQMIAALNAFAGHVVEVEVCDCDSGSITLWTSGTLRQELPLDGAEPVTFSIGAATLQIDPEAFNGAWLYPRHISIDQGSLTITVRLLSA